MSIILYDIPCSKPGEAWSPNTWKARAVLNYKGILYHTEWLEYPDIAPLSKKLGISPTDRNKDGSPIYTLPAIYDPSTGIYVSDSLHIADYLEKMYPDTPSIFPGDSAALQKAFEISSFVKAVLPFIIPAACLKLNPPSQEYYRRTREISFGMKLENLVPTGDTRTEEWGKLQEGLGKLHSCLVSTDNKGPYMMGHTISWSDLVIFSFLYCFKSIFGEDSKEWKDIASWNDGRWEAHLNGLKEYDTVI